MASRTDPAPSVPLEAGPVDAESDPAPSRQRSTWDLTDIWLVGVAALAALLAIYLATRLAGW